MHAYAADDPLFVAMNARAQRESHGKLAGFCVGCHAPMALREGRTVDGLNLSSLPSKLRGVTCFFCHSVDQVTGSHDAALSLGTDGVIRGEIVDPIPNGGHASTYSVAADRGHVESATMCGACHDVQTPGGVDVERTFAEWSTTVFAHDAGRQRTCGNCHMAETGGPAASIPGAPQRRVHDHALVGLDIPMTPWPGGDGARSVVQSKLDPALDARLCVTAAGSVDVTLTNTRVGHAWPSGAAHDRRAWVEVVGYAGGDVVFQSGVVGSGVDVTSLADPSLLLLRESLFDARGGPVLFSWQASTSRSSTLPPTVTLDPGNPGYEHAVSRHYAAPATVDRVTMRVLVTPVGLDVVDALVATGDLDPSFRAMIPVYALASTALEWTADRGFACLP